VFRTGFEARTFKSKFRDWGWVYGEGRLRGKYGTACIFDGPIGDCEEWALMFNIGYPQEWSDKGLERFVELSEASPACPFDYGHVLRRRQEDARRLEEGRPAIEAEQIQGMAKRREECELRRQTLEEMDAEGIPLPKWRWGTVEVNDDF
jgi:hypothetical protein